MLRIFLLVFFCFQTISIANEINLEDPFYKLGWKNLQSWIQSGFDNILFTPNKEVHSLLTKLSFLNLLHPFQPFILGQKTFAVKMAAKFNIPIIFYGGQSGKGGKKVAANVKTFAASQDQKGFDMAKTRYINEKNR